MRVNRNRMNILRAAAIHALYADNEGEKGKGGADDSKAADKGGDKGKATEVKKIELTPDELEQQKQAAINAALEKERIKAAEDKKKADEAAEKKKLEDEKNFQELATKADEKRTKAEAERDALRLDAKRRDVKDSITDYLRENHKDYSGVEKYILPLITFDLQTTPEDITKAVKAAADQYVKDNPRASSAHGAPSGSSRGKLGGDIKVEDKPNNGNEQARRSFTASRF